VELLKINFSGGVRNQSTSPTLPLIGTIIQLGRQPMKFE